MCVYRGSSIIQGRSVAMESLFCPRGHGVPILSQGPWSPYSVPGAMESLFCPRGRTFCYIIGIPKNMVFLCVHQLVTHTYQGKTTPAE